MEQKEKTALYLVTCNYVFGLDYGVRFGVVGIFTTKEAAKEARKKTLEMWNDYYITKIKSESNGDEWEVRSLLEDECGMYVEILKIEPDKYYSASLDYTWDIPDPEVLIGGYLE